MAVPEVREFTIAQCGFTETDQKVLNRSFMLSRVQAKRYTFWHPGAQHPSICAVNEDLDAGAAAWSALRDRFPTVAIPVIRIGMAPKDAGQFDQVPHTFFKRPILANRILKALDALVSNVYGFAPELSIHDNMSVQLASDEQALAGEDASGSSPAAIHEPASPQATVSARRILIVDDSESVRKIMELRLVKMGFAVDFAETGEAALVMAQQMPYDLIFLDVMLPGINGYDVSRQLKRNRQIRCPIVMLTGKTSRMDKLRGSLAQADAYLTKPLTIDNLNQTLQRFLS